MLAMALLLPEGHLGGLGGSAGGVGGSVEGPIEPESDSVSIHLNFADEFSRMDDEAVGTEVYRRRSQP